MTEISEGKRYIDVSKAVSELSSLTVQELEYEDLMYNIAISHACKALLQQPSNPDVVEVVRCNDCRYHSWTPDPNHRETIHHSCDLHHFEVKLTGFCSEGIVGTTSLPQFGFGEARGMIGNNDGGKK